MKVLALLGLLISIAVSTAEEVVDDCGYCEENYPCANTKYSKRIGDYEYKYCKHKLNWHDAQSICAKEGGYLVTIDNHDIDMHAEFQFDLPDSEDFWIGLHRPFGTWVRKTRGGNQISSNVNYRNWGELEPDDSEEAKATKLCTHYQKNILKWKTSNCDEEKFFMCERQRACYGTYENMFPPVDGNVYKRCPFKFTYEDARQACFHDGAQLFSPNSAQENNHVKRNVGMYAWSGLRDFTGNGRWSFEDGAGYAWYAGDTRWANSKPLPNNKAAYLGKDGLLPKGKTLTQAFICERKQECTNEGVDTTGWIQGGENLRDYEYKLCTKPLTWKDAREVCQLDGADADLVSINSPHEQEFVLNTFLKEPSDYPTAWIGYNDLDKENWWAWSDKSEVTYENWYNDQPDNSKCRQHCGRISWTSPTLGEWTDASCVRFHQFICKRKKQPDRFCRCTYGGKLNNWVTFDNAPCEYPRDQEDETKTLLAKYRMEVADKCSFMVEQITAENMDGDKQPRAAIIKFKNREIMLNRRGHVYIDGNRKNAYRSHSGDDWSLRKINRRTWEFRSHGCEISVSYGFNGPSRNRMVTVQVPIEIGGEVEGQCGVCDRNDVNDYVLRHGNDIRDNPDRCQLIHNSWIRSSLNYVPPSL